mmetsp:Transcript_14614/g.15135  ORF Transcript_14614/g.15135 Transcript_14614/m.15135 type:complete len:279 (-) Transcript_14614:19-855(-)
MESSPISLTSKSSKPIIIIVTHPRSLSTILFRTLTNNSQNVSFFEPFTRFWINSAEIKLKNYSTHTKEDFKKSIESKIVEAEKEDKFLLIKDMCHIPEEYFLDYIKKLNETRTVKLVYLVRHPKAAYHSYNKKLNISREEVKNKFKIITMFQPLWEMYEKHKGKVIIAEDFQEEPSRVMKELYEHIGMEFKEEYMKFKPLIEEGVPEDWKAISLHWYDEALSSTEVKPGKTDLSKIVIDDEEVKEKMESQMSYYEKILEESKREGNYQEGKKSIGKNI